MLIAQQQCAQPPIARLRAATVNSACSAHTSFLSPALLPTVLQLLLLPQRFQVSSVSSESLFTVVAIVFAVIIIAVASVLLLPHLLPLLLLLFPSLLRPLLLMLLNIAWPVLAYPQ